MESGVPSWVPTASYHEIYLVMKHLDVKIQRRRARHSHQDDRVATVISGIWYLGYGYTFDPSGLTPRPIRAMAQGVPDDSWPSHLGTRLGYLDLGPLTRLAQRLRR